MSNQMYPVVNVTVWTMINVMIDLMSQLTDNFLLQSHSIHRLIDVFYGKCGSYIEDRDIFNWYPKFLRLLSTSPFGILSTSPFDERRDFSHSLKIILIFNMYESISSVFLFIKKKRQHLLPFRFQWSHSPIDSFQI